MSERSELSVKLHADGCNCCQSVLLAMNGDGTVSNEIALRMGTAFGSGMGKGEVCGAVTGALMVIGLRHGPDCPDQKDRTKQAKELASRFFAAFDERHQSHICRELLKLNGRRICDQVIASAVEILESLESDNAG